MPDPLGVMWGKSDASGSMHLLIGHLLDTAAVGELIWDSYLAPAVKRELDECSEGRGRALLALLCGLHDVGKATPAFQMKDDALAAVVQAAGFDWPRMPLADAKRWHHTVAGARIVQTELRSAGCDPQWLWPLIAGHHGCVPWAARLEPPRPEVQGRAAWPAAQRTFVERAISELGVNLADLAGVRPPTRGVQLALSGFVIMADWIASDERNFRGIPDLADVSMAGARERARRSWAGLGLRGGWDIGQLAGPDEPDLVRRRFAIPARPAQHDVVALAEEMETPGLLVVEAPMGEGKTEAALARGCSKIDPAGIDMNALSSPPARGCSHRPVPGALEVGVVPARAGVIRACRPARDRPERVVPAARG